VTGLLDQDSTGRREPRSGRPIGFLDDVVHAEEATPEGVAFAGVALDRPRRTRAEMEWA
jgi:hypothetical protein